MAKTKTAKAQSRPVSLSQRGLGSGRVLLMAYLKIERRNEPLTLSPGWRETGAVRVAE